MTRTVAARVDCGRDRNASRSARTGQPGRRHSQAGASGRPGVCLPASEPRQPLWETVRESTPLSGVVGRDREETKPVDRKSDVGTTPRRSASPAHAVRRLQRRPQERSAINATSAFPDPSVAAWWMSRRVRRSFERARLRATIARLGSFSRRFEAGASRCHARRKFLGVPQPQQRNY